MVKSPAFFIVRIIQTIARVLCNTKNRHNNNTTIVESVDPYTRSSPSHPLLTANQWGTRMTQAATTITQPPKPCAEIRPRDATELRRGQADRHWAVRNSPPKWKHKTEEPLQEPHTPSGAEIQCHWYILNDEILGSNENIYLIICIMYVILDEVAGVTLFWW